MHLVISCSLNPKSRSRIMAKHAHGLYCKESEFLDLRDIDMPICDGDTCYDSPVVAKLKETIEAAGSIIIAGPIYNYDLNAAAKNLLELTGSSWNNKLVGFICAAGGSGSYMSPTSFMNSLMLDFRCIIIPRFVYAEGSSFDASGAIDSSTKDRLEELVDTSIFMSRALEKHCKT